MSRSRGVALAITYFEYLLVRRLRNPEQTGLNPHRRCGWPGRLAPALRCDIQVGTTLHPQCGRPSPNRLFWRLRPPHLTFCARRVHETETDDGVRNTAVIFIWLYLNLRGSQSKGPNLVRVSRTASESFSLAPRQTTRKVPLK